MHDCPLITAVPGKLYDAWVVDGLHSWALGPLGELIGSIFKLFLRTKVFAPSSVHIDSEDLDRLALLHIKALLQVHYKKVKRDPNHKRTHTEVCSKASGISSRLRPLSRRPYTPYNNSFMSMPFCHMMSGLESNEGDVGKR